MLKRCKTSGAYCAAIQPPLGGCVLKHASGDVTTTAKNQPPLGGCVLKQEQGCVIAYNLDSAAFRRLCVETSL